MIFKSTRLTVLTISILLFSVLGAVLFSASTSALAGGASIGQGYFDRQYYGDGIASDLIQDCDGSGMPFKSSMVSKSAFISTVLNYYEGTCNKGHNKTGAEFIIQSMNNTRQRLGDSTYTNWKQRWQNFINDDRVTITWENFSYDINSTYKTNGTKGDVVFVNYPGTRASLVFRFNGKFFYAIKGDCGNTVGEQLPVWEAIPEISPKGNNTIQPGQQIVWTHWARVNLSNITQKTVTVTAEKLWSKEKVSGPGLPAFSYPGQTSSKFTTTYNVTSADIGKTFCAVTNVNPWYGVGSIEYGPLASDKSCFTVTYTPPPDTDPCRPIKIYAEPRNYDINISTKDAGSRFISQPRPITAATSYASYGPYSTKTMLPNPEFTRIHTTGEDLTVTFKESQNHVTGSQDNYKDIYDWVDTCVEVYDPLTGKIRKDCSTSYEKVGVEYVNSYVLYSDGSYTISPTISYNGNGGSWSTAFGPCYDYMLSASLNNFYARKEAEESIAVSPTITSKPFTQSSPTWSGFWGEYQTHSKSKSTYWQITLMKIPVNVKPPEAKNELISGIEPCSYFDNVGISQCNVAQSGKQVFGKGSDSVGGGYTVPDDYAGTKLCYAFSLFPNQSDPANRSHAPGGSDQWYHAPFDPSTNCVIVVKKPKLQVWGGDLRAGNLLAGSNVSSGGTVYTSTSNKLGKMFGSWVEYGILATGSITGMASGAAIAGGESGATACYNAQLSFANLPVNNSSCTGTLGSYRFGSQYRNISSYFPTSSSTPVLSGSVNVSSLKNEFYTTKESSLTITGGSLSKTLVINAPGTVINITGDLQYPDVEYSAIGQIPQLIIIAKDINIAGGVSRIDGWLVAQLGTIMTCSDVNEGDSLNVNICNNQLQINGPVSASRIILKRTYGSDPGPGSDVPAEIFNLRNDTYLWVYASSVKDNRLINTYLTEAPPRL